MSYSTTFRSGRSANVNPHDIADFGTRQIRQSGRNRNLLNAEIAAREIGDLSLGNALEYCLLLSDVGGHSSMNRWSQRKPVTS